MIAPPRRKSLQTIRDQAGAWVQRRQSSNQDEADERRFRDWLCEDPRHVHEYERLAAIWSDPDLWSALQIKDAAKGAASRTRTRMLAAGGLALTACALVTLTLTRAPAPDIETFSTAAGEIRRFDLPDGSILTLSGRSAGAITISKNLRTFDLAEGEALFSVAHDGRPFVVTAGPLKATALGTRFNIDRGATGADLAVIEGRVRAEAGTNVSILAANQTVRATSRGLATLSTPVDAQIAWIEGRIDVSDTTVGAMMAELSRFTRKPIVVADAALAGKPVAGHFDVKNAEATMRLVADLHQATVTETEAVFVVAPQSAIRK